MSKSHRSNLSNLSTETRTILKVDFEKKIFGNLCSRARKYVVYRAINKKKKKLYVQNIFRHRVVDHLNHRYFFKKMYYLLKVERYALVLSIMSARTIDVVNRGVFKGVADGAAALRP